MYLLILAVLSVLLAVVVAWKVPRSIPIGFLVGAIALLLDILVESWGIIGGNWGYPNSIYMVRVGNIVAIPLEMILLSFSCGIILSGATKFFAGTVQTWQFYPADVMLLVGVVLLIIYAGGYAPALIMGLTMLAMFGIMVSDPQKLKWLVVGALLAWILDAIIETGIVTLNNDYWYENGYDFLLVGFLYMLTFIFLVSIIIMRRGKSALKPSGSD